jgi:hydroxyethylthiazole kinase-like sugar kinase family protein
MTTKVNSSVLDFSTLDGYAANLKVGFANVANRVTGLTSANVTTALGADPVQNATTAVNVTGLTYANVLTAISTNGVPLANVATRVTGLTSANVTTALGADPVQNATTAVNVTGLTYANVLTAIGTDGVPLANVATRVTGLTSANVTTALGSDPVQNATTAVNVTGLTSANVTTALGFTPISATSNVNTTIRSLGVATTSYGNVGEIRAIDNITAYFSSDARLKENVENIANAVTTVSAIGGKTFDWTDEYINHHGGEDGYFVQKQDFGVIAQDVQAVFPRAVRTRQDGMLAVDYEKLSALAFAAIQELSSEMQDLRAKIQELESKINAKP